MDRKKFLPFIVLGGIALFVILIFANSIFLTIQPGEKGVLFKRCIQVFDENGRFNPTFDEKNTSFVKSDTLLVAIGQQFDLSFLDPETCGLIILKNGSIEHNPDSLETTRRNVFVAGDLAHGPKLIIDAVASGKKVARSIYHRFCNEKIEVELIGFFNHLINYKREFDFEQRGRLEPPVTNVKDRTQGQIKVVELSLSREKALKEAGRCLDCRVNTIIDSSKCLLCGACVDICPLRCFKIVPLNRVKMDSPLISLRQRIFNEEKPATEEWISAIIKDDEKCIRCALCAERCPEKAITMELYCIKEMVKL